MKRNVTLIFSFLSIIFLGCSNIQYSGKFYDDLEANLSQTFLAEHQVNTSTTQNDLPKQIIYAVDSEEKYNVAFKSDYRININYETELMFLCSFVSIYRMEHHLNSLGINDGVLMIECDYKKGAPGTGYACSPYQRWCAITLEKVNYDSIIFIGESA